MSSCSRGHAFSGARIARQYGADPDIVMGGAIEHHVGYHILVSHWRYACADRRVVTVEADPSSQ